MGNGVEGEAIEGSVTVKRRIFILVNGILCWPNSHLWNFHGTTWINTHTDHSAQNLMYFCTAVGRRFHQQARIARLVALLEAYRGWEIYGIGHSNGCDIWVKALAQSDYPRIEALHLVSGACVADFNKNGLNGALLDGTIGRVAVYCGGQDKALLVASTWLGRALGYGCLGLHGPKNVDPLITPDRCAKVVWPTFGHSTCWQPENFQRTMQHLVADENPTGTVVATPQPPTATETPSVITEKHE